MGRYAQAKRRGSAVPSETALEPAPVITNANGDELDWTWGGVDPANWTIQTSVDGVSEWEDQYETDGTARNWISPQTELYYRIRGGNEFFNPVTGWSNIMFCVTI